MKYFNSLNILLAGLSVLLVGYAMIQTIWKPEAKPQLNIPSQSSEPRSSSRPTGSLSPATERRNLGARRISAPGTRPRDPIQAPGQAVAPAPSASIPVGVPPRSETTSVISTSGAPTNTGREAKDSPLAQPRPQAVGKSRPARQTRPLSRPYSGRPGFAGEAKRGSQDGPASPPVRSSFPAQRLP